MPINPSHRSLAIVALVMGIGVVAFGARSALQAQVANVFVGAAQAEEGFTVAADRNTTFFCLMKTTGGTTFPLIDTSLQNRPDVTLTISETTARVGDTATRNFTLNGNQNDLTVFERGKLYTVRSDHDLFFRCDDGLKIEQAGRGEIANPSENPAGEEEDQPQNEEEDQPTEEQTDEPEISQPSENFPIENPLKVEMENPIGEIHRGTALFMKFTLTNDGDNTLDQVGFSLQMPTGYAIPVGGTSGNCSGQGNQIGCQNFVLSPHETLRFNFPFFILPTARCGALEQTRVAAIGHLQNMNDLPNVNSNFAAWSVQCESSSASSIVFTEPTNSASSAASTGGQTSVAQNSQASQSVSSSRSSSSRSSSRSSSSLGLPLSVLLSGPNGLMKDESASYTLVLKNTTTSTAFRDIAFNFAFPTGVTTAAQSTLPNCSVTTSGMSCTGLVIQPQLSLTLTLPIKTTSTMPCTVLPFKVSATTGGTRYDSNTINVQGCTGGTSASSVAVTSVIQTDKTYLEKNVEYTMQLQVAALGTSFSGGTLRVEMPGGVILRDPVNSLNVGDCSVDGTVFECTGIDRGSNQGAVYKLPLIITDSTACGKSEYKVSFTYVEGGLEKTIVKNQGMNLCYAIAANTGPFDGFMITAGTPKCESADCRLVSIPVTLTNKGPVAARNTIVTMDLDTTWKEVTMNGALCMIVDLPTTRMFDCPGSNYLTIPPFSDLSYSLLLQTDATCPIASPRTAVLIQSAPASVYDEDYSNNSVYASLPSPCQSNSNGGSSSSEAPVWDVEIQNVSFSADNDVATVQLSKNPGTASSVKFNLYKNDALVGESDVPAENGTVTHMRGLKTIFENHGGAGQYRLDFYSCAEEGNGGCSPIFSTSVQYAGQQKPLSATVSRVSTNSITLTASRAPEANEYFYASCSPYTGLEDSAGYTKNRTMDVINLQPNTIYTCRMYTVPSAVGGDTMISSPEVEAKTLSVQTITVDATAGIAGPGTVAPGSVLTYTVSIANVGTKAAAIRSLNQVAQGLDFNREQSDGRCALSTLFNPPRLSCDFGNIDANGSTTFTLAFNVSTAATCNTTFTQQITANTTETDKDYSNNTAENQTKVVCASAASAASVPSTSSNQTCTGGGAYSGLDCSDNIVSLEDFSYHTEPFVNGTVTAYGTVTMAGANDENTQMVSIRYENATYSPERAQPNTGTVYLSTELQYNRTYRPVITVMQRVTTKTSITNNIVFRKALDPITIDPPAHVFSTAENYGLFVTPISMQGNLKTNDPRIPTNLAWTGRADLICNLAAQDAGLSAPNTNMWHSLLSNSHGAKFPLYNMKNELLAQTEDDLWNLQRGRLPAAITNVFGQDASGYVWTGRDPTGKITTNTCKGWSSPYTQDSGTVGVINGFGGEWYQSGNQNCSNFAALYCTNTELQ